MLARLARGVGWLDVALAAALTLIGVTATLTADDYVGGRTRLTVALLLQTVPLVWRRTAPLRAVALSAAGVAVEVAGVAAWGDIAGFFGYLTLAYAVPRWAPSRDRVVAGVVLATGFVVHLASQPHDGVGEVVGSIISAGVLTAAAWGFGTAMRTRAARVEALEHDVIERDRRWQEERQAVVDEERRRISRDLHDIVGHALAAISLSAAGAEASLPETGLDDVRTSLSLIRATSRDAAADVRRLVGLLRTAEDENPMTPQPTLASVGELVDRARVAGLDVAVGDAPPAADVPLGVQLAVYRVVQEGLTNAAKHAPGARAEVRISREEGRIVVRVETTPRDDGGGTTGAPPAGADRAAVPGHGLVGLEERVALYQGSLQATPSPGGGFVLVAEMALP